MTTLTKDTLKGFVPAIVTPFNPAGEIMEDEFADIVGWLIDCGAQGICVAGDNGESWTLDVTERARLTRLAVDRAAGRVPIIMGATARGRRRPLNMATRRGTPGQPGCW
jgi:4-hydroxy-tetrahydrodipicolinate synthase